MTPSFALYLAPLALRRTSCLSINGSPLAWRLLLCIFGLTMKVPLQISFHGITPSPAIENEIRQRAAKLDRFYKRLTACRVVVEEPHRHHRKGKRFSVRIDLSVPGDELVVCRSTEKSNAPTNIHFAIRDAFDNALRQLQGYAERHRGETKTHVEPPHGRIARLFPNEECGFLESADGREVYFHARSVLNNDFNNLSVGNEVRFAEELGDKGPQASSVEVVGKDGRHVFSAGGAAVAK